jgi:uncharacterized SAM-binding protein YcdF (DUF218 family)
MRLLPLVVAVAALAAADAQHRRASRRGVPRPTGGLGQESVVVLGFRNRGSRANAVNRYRVRAALRSRHTPGSVLVLCGGSVAGAIPEAELMARYARRQRGYDGPLVLECESRTTEENLRNAAALLVRAEEHRFGEVPLQKLVASVLEGTRSARSRASRPGGRTAARRGPRWRGAARAHD